MSTLEPINAVEARAYTMKRADAIKGAAILRANKAIRAAMEQGQFSVIVDIPNVTLIKHQNDLKAHFQNLGYVASINAASMTMTITW